MNALRPSTSQKAPEEKGTAVSVSLNERGGIYWLGKRAFVTGLALVVITVAVYWPVRNFEFINYDDHEYVTENYHVLAGLTWRGAAWAFTTGHTGNWHPLTWLSHMADCQFFGKHAGWHHLTNVLFHAANTVLLFALLRKMTGALWRAAFVAALFALHPLHVESVAWVSERKDVLSTFFGFLSLIFYVGYVSKSQVPSLKSKGWPLWPPSVLPLSPSLSYALSLFFFALGLMSKPMLVTWPFVMLLLDYWPLNRFTNRKLQIVLKGFIREKIPFFALSAVSCVVTFMVQRAGGAVETLSGVSLSLRVQNALVSYTRYLGKTFWPVNLVNPYPYPAAWPWETVLLAGVLVAGLSALAMWLARTRPYFFVGWFWFWGMLIPVIGLVQVGMQAMADRYMYVPVVGLFIALIWATGELMLRARIWRTAFVAVGILLLSAAAARTAGQISCWRNSGLLFSHAISMTKNNEIALSNLGNYFFEEGRLDEAIDNYRKALESIRASADSPPCEALNVNVASLAEGTTKDGGQFFFQINPHKTASGAEILNNLGTALDHKGRVEDAMQCYRTALRLKPDYALALYNLGGELASRKEYNQAIEYYEAAVRLKPDQPDLRNALGSTLVEIGRIDDAIYHYNEALRLSPNDAKAHNYLGLALAAQGKAAEAIPHYEIALRSDPTQIEIHNNLGSALVNVGNLDEAIRHFRLLLQWMPDHHRAHVNLGVALAMKGRLEEATLHFQEALRLNPGNADTHLNFGNVLALQHRFEEAQRQYEETLRLVPDQAQAHCCLGGVLAELGHRDEAIAHFKEALRLNPNYWQAREQLNKLGVAEP